MFQPENASVLVRKIKYNNNVPTQLFALGQLVYIDTADDVMHMWQNLKNNQFKKNSRYGYL